MNYLNGFLNRLSRENYKNKDILENVSLKTKTEYILIHDEFRPSMCRCSPDLFFIFVSNLKNLVSKMPTDIRYHIFKQSGIVTIF